MTPEEQRQLDRKWTETGYEELGIGFGRPAADPEGPQAISQTDARRLIDKMADAMQMPDPAAARTHMRLAILDYSHAYRNARTLPPVTVRSVIAHAWLHLEKAVSMGWSRADIEEHFYRIRARFTEVLP